MKLKKFFILYFFVLFVFPLHIFSQDNCQYTLYFSQENHVTGSDKNSQTGETAFVSVWEAAYNNVIVWDPCGKQLLTSPQKREWDCFHWPRPTVEPVPDPTPIQTSLPETSVFMERNGMVVMEAEHYSEMIERSGHSWKFFSFGTGFSGDGYIAAFPDAGLLNNTDYASLSTETVYPVSFMTTGKYYVWTRAHGRNEGGNSAHAGINGVENTTANRLQFSTRFWHWKKERMDPGDAYITISESGVQTFHIWMREDGALIDKIILTTNPYYIPWGTGPDESPVMDNVTPAPTPEPTPEPTADTTTTTSFSSSSSSTTTSIHTTTTSFSSTSSSTTTSIYTTTSAATTTSSLTTTSYLSTISTTSVISTTSSPNDTTSIHTTSMSSITTTTYTTTSSPPPDTTSSIMSDQVIQDAIDAASPGDTVIVEPGPYYAHIQLKPGITLQASETGITSLWEREEGVPIVIMAENSAINGFLMGSDHQLIYCEGVSATIRNNEISRGDTGIVCIDSSIVIENNIIHRCNLGIYINNTQVQDNSITITNNYIYDIYDYGIYIDNGTGIIINNILYNNTSGINFLYFTGAIANNTVVNNTLHGLFLSNSTADVMNNIIVSGGGYGINCFQNMTLNLQYNNVWNNVTDYNGVTQGPTDISSDPLFVNPTDGDFHLFIDSPCVDTGTNNVPGLPGVDFDGNSRITDGDNDGTAIIDMGALEADDNSPSSPTLSPTPEPTPVQEIINIPDPELEKIVRQVIDKDYGDIYITDVENITTLKCESAGIQNLSGLQYFTSLQNLYLANNYITDVTPLEQLDSLNYIDLSMNNLSDLQSFSGLVSLQRLSLMNNFIEDLGPIGQLTSLAFLDISFNRISDLAPLANLASLQTLFIHSFDYYTHFLEREEVLELTSEPDFWNYAEDTAFSLYSGNTVPPGDPELYKNTFSDISPLGNLTSLTILDIESDNITDISPLANLDNLTNVIICSDSLIDLEPVAGFISLGKVGIKSDSLSDISPLSNLSQISVIGIFAKNVANISALAGTTVLEGFYIRSDLLSDISPLANCTCLTDLILSSPLISDINPLSQLSELSSIIINSDTLSDISPLGTLPALNFLTINSDSLTSIDTLADITSLKRLNINSQVLSDISPLGALLNLYSLRIRSDALSDLDVIGSLTGLSRLEISSHSVSDLGSIAGLADLNLLIIDCPNITDLTPLGNLTYLETLKIVSDNVSDLGPLANLVRIQKLVVSSENVSDISVLEGFESLHTLDMQGCNLEDLTPLYNLTELRYINLGSNNISDTKAFDGLSDLSILILNNNNISDISILSELSNLTLVDISSNPVSDTGSLITSRNVLNILDIRNTLVSDLSPIANFKYLHCLLAEENSITDISPLQGMESLDLLYLANNNIIDLTPLTSLDDLILLDIRENPLLDDNSINIIIPELESNGTKVLQ